MNVFIRKTSHKWLAYKRKCGPPKKNQITAKANKKPKKGSN